MIEIGLSMMVKNEAANIVPCLEPIADLFSQIVVIDTGSTDGTRELLQERFGITALQGELSPQECFALATQRNRSFGLLRTPWILTLDADERIRREDLLAVLAQDDRDLPSGLFCGWDTEAGDDTLVEDYKLCLFRKGHEHRGLVHDTAQPSLREKGGTAQWCPRLRLRHVPDLRRVPEKAAFYEHRLGCAQKRDPSWLRYHWFLGFMHFRSGRLDAARRQLEAVHRERPARFPVESLNASMVLAEMHASQGDRAGAQQVLMDARDFHERVQDDFEVRVNFRMRPWLEQALADTDAGRLEAVRTYPFAY